jgi:hypothetical protein
MSDSSSLGGSGLLFVFPYQQDTFKYPMAEKALFSPGFNLLQNPNPLALMFRFAFHARCSGLP